MSEKSGEELYVERVQRIQDNIELKETDRVPYTFFSHFWSATLAEMTFEDAMYDYDRYNDAMRKTMEVLNPDDYAMTQIFISLGPTLERMGFKQLEWPGHGTDPNVSYQFLDKEYMSADEYDDYLRDPTGFFLRKYMPRVATAFEPLAMLPNFSSLYYTKMIRATTAFANPKLMEGFEEIAAAGREMRKMMGGAIAFTQEMEALGYPQSIGGTAAAPFDHFADYLRGSKGAMLDMFRHKDKLLEAMEKAAYFIAEDTIDATKHNPCKQVFIPLHWGLDGFMSPDQFNTFFWPQLRKIILMLIEADLTPCVLWEGDCDTRLEFIGDIPAKKAIYWFEKTDLKKAKDVLGDVVCLRGNVPSSMLTTGTPDDVDEYCKDLIKHVGKGGGFILDGAIGVPDEAKVDNVVAMAQSVHKYAN
ncbi:MAG: uroporphyrinogen decarboxylase family protein [Rhodospirillales bacterium]|nr:uroporphyrinogen decarboxylase family protein [Rhodospirillales bacterium]